MASSEPTVLLIDSDVVAYAAASASQETYRWDDGDVSMKVEPFEDALEKACSEIDGYAKQFKADRVIVCLSVPSNEGWRKTILPSYKENRTGIEKPVHLMAIKHAFTERYETFIRPTLEADDVMGILSTHPKLIPGRKIIVSIDKDMKTIPGWLYNPQKDDAPWLVSEAEADYWHMYQTLVGDTTDGYVGCPGVGPAKAEHALRQMLKPVPIHREISRGPRKGEIDTKWDLGEAEDYWDTVVSHYVKFGLTEQDALIQARVARICRHTDYCFKRKEVILWQPPAKPS